MKQRLGIAQALLHDPDLIILDEPTTGLDPQGMKEIRELIIYLSKEKQKTIFLSTHILYEVELVANRMVIINRGSTQVEGRVDDLLNADELKVTFQVDDDLKAKRLINETGWINKLDSSVNGKLIFNLSPSEIPLLNKYFVENNLLVSAVIPMRSLEEFFLKLTEKES
jgi:ABC-type multidrug transport system ATPase subunit